MISAELELGVSRGLKVFFNALLAHRVRTDWSGDLMLA